MFDFVGIPVRRVVQKSALVHPLGCQIGCQRARRRLDANRFSIQTRRDRRRMQPARKQVAGEPDSPRVPTLGRD